MAKTHHVARHRAHGGLSAGNPATPSILPGPEALRHCLATVLPKRFLYWLHKQSAWHSLQVRAPPMLRSRARRVKILAAWMLL